MSRQREETYSLPQYYGYGTFLFTSTSFLATPFLLLKRRLQMGLDATVMGLWRKEGLRGSFRGGSLSWISGCNRMVYFTIYERAVQSFNNIDTDRRGIDISPHVKSSCSNATAAAIASITSQAILTPVAVVQTRLHVNQGPIIPARSVLRTIIAQHGGWGILWTGYSSALLQAVPLNMTLFAVYTFTCSHAEEFGLMKTPVSDLLVRLACSFLGTYAAVIVTSPIDIVRTHRQALVSDYTGVAAVGGGMTAAEVPSSMAIFKEICSKFGWRHMYSGATARLLSSTPFTVAMLIGYDYVKLFSRIERHESKHIESQ